MEKKGELDKESLERGVIMGRGRKGDNGRVAMIKAHLMLLWKCHSGTHYYIQSIYIHKRWTQWENNEIKINGIILYESLQAFLICKHVFVS